MSPWDWSSAQSLSLKKTPELQLRPSTAREENGSQLICLHSRIPLWRGSPVPRPPSRPAGLPPSLLQDRPRQVWTDVNFWLLSLTRGGGGGVEKFVRFVSDSWEWLSRFRGPLKFGGQQIFISLLVGWGWGDLHPCAPGLCSRWNWRKPAGAWLSVFVHGFPLFVPNRESNPGWQCKLWGRQVGENKNCLKK